MTRERPRHIYTSTARRSGSSGHWPLIFALVLALIVIVALVIVFVL